MEAFSIALQSVWANSGYAGFSIGLSLIHIQMCIRDSPNISLVALWQEQPSWGPDAVSLRAYQKGKSPWLGGLDIDDYQGNPILAAKAIGVDIVSPYYPEISKRDVDLAHELGMKVVPWTVNSVTDINMMIDMGVDCLLYTSRCV